jgi:hypothetical protein
MLMRLLKCIQIFYSDALVEGNGGRSRISPPKWRDLECGRAEEALGEATGTTSPSETIAGCNKPIELQH